MSDLVGKNLGKYRVVARLGRGGMAEVYKAYQAALDRYVAVKVMHSHLIEDGDFVGRFKREATAVADLRHPNVVRVYDFDVSGDLYYMVMEYIEGPTLKAELKERSIKGQIFNLPETTRIFSALASAIDYAHSRGMVHRDLKPANIMFTREGQVVLTDFGIARIMGATQYTMTGAISGTPAYMSPEQGQGERGDERSDIYSLGVILYEMVLGSVPFDADTPFAIIMKHINDPLPMPRAISPDLPDGVERVILKALSKNPDDRYQTAGEMSQALREAAGVSAEQTLSSVLIATIAPTPRVEEVPVGPGIGVPSAPGSAQAAQPQAATAAPRKIAGLPFLPVVLGVGAVAFVCIVALAVVLTRLATTGQLAQRAQQESINATQAAIAVAIATQEADTPTPLPTLTDYPTYTPPPSPTERVVVVTPTPLPAADTPSSPPLTTDTPPPPPTYTPLPTYTLQPTHTPLPPPTDTPAPPVSAETEVTEEPTPAASDETPTPEAEVVSISGRLAVPVDNGFGSYDVIVYQLPDAEVVGEISNARQPNFRSDGVLAVNGVGGGADNVWEYTADGTAVGEVSASPGDNHPFWKADASGIVYDNPEMVCAKISCPEWHVFVQAGVNKPETGIVADKFILDGDIFRDQPMYPLWASDDHILFRACDIWLGGSGGGRCGIWRTPSWATRGGTGFSVPANLTSNDDIPTDTKGDRLVYMSAKDGNWEVYVMGITGGQATNVSKDSADDGLGTISPDGKWVAFVSNRGGSWGVWVVPINGGSATRVPIDVLAWGSGGRDWTNERMSWGP